MHTVTLKVSDETRAAWQAAADHATGGNVSEWIRSVCDPAASELDRLRRATGSVRPEERTHLLVRDGQVGIVRNSVVTDRATVVAARPPVEGQTRRFP